jgi:hypothetical protein
MPDPEDATAMLQEAETELGQATNAVTAGPHLERASALALVAIGVYLESIQETLAKIAREGLGPTGREAFPGVSGPAGDPENRS